jgi:2-keto-4-pentenoate hydratase
MPAPTQQRLPPEQVKSFAQALVAAFESGVAIEPITASRPDLTPSEAYAIQRELLRHHERAGRRVVGRKIGLTSPAIQRQLGIDSPDFGVLLDTHVFSSGDAVSISELRMIAPRVEAEVGFVLSAPLQGPGVTAADVLAVTSHVAPVFELIDSRIRDWKISLADTVADNASCLGAVLGASIPLAQVGPLPTLEVTIARDARALERGRGEAVMGDPAAAVAWLANALADFGEALPGGEPILSGSFTAAIDATPGLYQADFGDQLGVVSLRIDE